MDRPDRYLADEVVVPPLIGVPEVRKLLGVSRQRVFQIRTTAAGFPPAAATTEMGPLWFLADIEAWIAVTAAERKRWQEITGTFPRHIEGAT